MGRQATAYGDAMRAFVARVCKELVLEIDKELRKRGTGTPVDTGHARACWIPSVGSPVFSDPSGNDQSAHDAGVGAVLSFKLGDGVLYVSNAAPYIGLLNRGTSKQAPAMFIEACVDRAVARVQARYEGRIDLGRSQIQSGFGAPGAGNLASAYSPFGDD